MSRTATPPATDIPIETRRRSPLRFALPDALIAIALGTIAFILRRNVPADGLFYNDAWQALGAWKGSFSEFITVGQTQPGFTVGLMIWTRLFGVGTTALLTPALIAGTLGPPALYIALRQFGYARSVAFLAGAALSSTQVHIIYSYAVKTYTFDVLIMLGLALVVWQLARRCWRASTAVAWFIGSVVVGSFSSIALMATGTAGLILALHPCGDRKLRVATTAAQLLMLATIYLASSRTYNPEQLLGFFEVRGGFIDFDPNPVTFGREVFTHFWHVADVFPGGPPSLSLAFAMVGLLATAWRGPLVVPARFLALAVIVAVGGSVVGRVPFGPPRGQGRVSLWLVPAIALGLCAALEFARRQLAARVALRAGFDAIACVAAVVLLIAGLGTDHPYAAGARSAIRQVMASAGPRDAVVITWPTTYSFALYGNTPVHLRPTPDHPVGFFPAFSDERLYPHESMTTPFMTTPEEFDDFVKGADRVYVVHANNARALGYGNVKTLDDAEYLFALAVELVYRGFTHESTTTVETGQIDIWRRKTG
jgi:hypothetical protein